MRIPPEEIIANVRDERETFRKIYHAVLEIEKMAKRKHTASRLEPLKHYIRTQDSTLTNWLLRHDIVEGEVVEESDK